MASYFNILFSLIFFSVIRYSTDSFIDYYENLNKKNEEKTTTTNPLINQHQEISIQHADAVGTVNAAYVRFPYAYAHKLDFKKAVEIVKGEQPSWLLHPISNVTNYVATVGNDIFNYIIRWGIVMFILTLCIGFCCGFCCRRKAPIINVSFGKVPTTQRKCSCMKGCSDEINTS